MRYVVVDTETTGLPEEGAQLVEVAALSRRQDGSLGTFEGLCDPGIPIPAVAMAVHHITNEMVAGKPSPAELREQLVEEMGGYGASERVVWVAHNAAFDRQFLPELADERWICTYRCAMHVWPEAPAHGNQTLRYFLGLDQAGGLALPPDLHPHRALYDILVTEGILRALMRAVARRLGEDATEEDVLEELVRLSTAPVVLDTVRFGKHRGRKWEWVVRNDRGWCDWYLKTPDPDDDVRHTIIHHRRQVQGRLL